MQSDLGWKQQRAGGQSLGQTAGESEADQRLRSTCNQIPCHRPCPIRVGTAASHQRGSTGEGAQQACLDLEAGEDSQAAQGSETIRASAVVMALFRRWAR